MKYKVSDYIVEFLVNNKVTDVFGYPGGMVTHLMDSFGKYSKEVSAHVSYHEQAAAFEACGYAQASGKIGVAYATSGPGATNLITGIANAYFDSIPVLFITGQVNTFESSVGMDIRQRGFQETNVVSIVRNITKKAVYISESNEIPNVLDDLYRIAMTDRKGPVLLDIPMDILRSEINVESPKTIILTRNRKALVNKEDFRKELSGFSRPCLLLGLGAESLDKYFLSEFIKHENIPVVTSMPAVDLLGISGELGYGFIGAYGDRVSNFIVSKADLLLTIGARLDIRQTGAKRSDFAPNAKIVRIDVDKDELSYKVHDNELSFCMDAKEAIELLLNTKPQYEKTDDWILVCNEMKSLLKNRDKRVYNDFVENISRIVNKDTLVTTDVGQNQVWVAQSFNVNAEQRIFFSSSHGAMGYSLPAAIGVYYATRRPVISINGDGGVQMNIQELEFIKREHLPIKLFVFNNKSLGMIRHFQEMYFNKTYVQTIEAFGYSTPDFEKLASAYNLDYYRYDDIDDFDDEWNKTNKSAIIEIVLSDNTHVFPKLEYGRPNQDQEPLLDRGLYDKIMNL